MDKKAIIVPIGLFILSLVFYQLVLAAKESALSPSTNTGKILIAKEDIPARTLMTPLLVEVATIPRKFMAQDAFEVETTAALNTISNLVTRIPIPKGNQVTQSALISVSPDAGLSVKIPPGYRGALVGVQPELKMLIKPGDRVDVLVTFDALMADGKKEKVTATSLQNVLVIGVGGDLGQGLDMSGYEKNQAQAEKNAAFSEKATIALALNPNEAQYLALAMKQGEPSILLRALGDAEMHPMEMASFRKLFN